MSDTETPEDQLRVAQRMLEIYAQKLANLEWENANRIALIEALQAQVQSLRTDESEGTSA